MIHFHADGFMLVHRLTVQQRWAKLFRGPKIIQYIIFNQVLILLTRSGTSGERSYKMEQFALTYITAQETSQHVSTKTKLTQDEFWDKLQCLAWGSGFWCTLCGTVASFLLSLPPPSVVLPGVCVRGCGWDLSSVLPHRALHKRLCRIILSRSVVALVQYLLVFSGLAIVCSPPTECYVSISLTWVFSLCL